MNKSEKQIIKLLLSKKIPLSIYQIAKDTNITYPTVKKYIEQLEKEGYLEIVESKKNNIKNDVVFEYKFKEEILQQLEKEFKLKYT